MTYLTGPAFGGRARGRGGAMGDVGGTATVNDLVAQVNRFGQSAPSGYQFVTSPFQPAPLPFGIQLLPITIDLATTALTIYQRRATDAYNQFHDAGSQQAIANANAGYADPVAFVSQHLAEITATLQAYADSLGIPPAVGDSTGSTGISTGTLLLAAAVAAWWLLR